MSLNLRSLLKEEYKYRKSLKLTDKFLRLKEEIKNNNSLDECFYKKNMSFIIKKPDLQLILFNFHLLPISVLVKYQDSIFFSMYFLLNRNYFQNYIYFHLHPDHIFGSGQLPHQF